MADTEGEKTDKEAIVNVEETPINTGGPLCDPNNPQGPPPSYDSIYGKLRAERKKTKEHSTFVVNACTIITSSIGFTILLVIMLALPIAMIVIGALNLSNCPIQRFIPIWLVVAGSTSALLQLINLCMKYARKDEELQEHLEHEGGPGSGKTGNAGPNGLLGCFNFAWFIAGNVWVFSVHNKVQYDNSALLDTYCDATTYKLAFWGILSAYIFIGFFCCCGCCLCAAFAKDGANNPNNSK